MKKTKKLAALLLIATLSISLAACGGGDSTQKSEASSTPASSGNSQSDSKASTGVKTLADGTLTMSTNAEFEPFEYRSGSNIVGIDVDIANKIAKKLGLTLKINDVAFDSLTTELQSNKCDFVAAGMTADEDRKKNVDFSDPYFDASQAIIVQKGSAIQSRTDLNGKTVGVQQGTTGDKYCTNEKGESDIKVGKVKRYNKGADAITDMISGRIDAVVIDDFPASKFVEKNSAKVQKLNDSRWKNMRSLSIRETPLCAIKSTPYSKKCSKAAS